MKWKTTIICSAVLYGSWKLAEYQLLDEEVYMGFEQRCRKYGLNVEKHFITTDDGYILQMFRVRYGKDTDKMKSNPIILQHGFMDSCYCWIINGEKSPSVALAKNGYDVWIANSRGTSFSRFHKYLDPDHDLKYWDFTFEEMGLYDTKAEIDYIKNETQREKVAYIGASQGSTQMLYALVCDNEYYIKNLSIFIGLCPVAKTSEKTDVGFLGSKRNSDIYFKIHEYFNKVEYKANSLLINRFKCAFIKLCPSLVENHLKKSTDLDPSANDITAMQREVSYFSQGYNTKTLKYWSQLFLSHQFEKFDHGEKENLKRYGSPQPPKIEISRIKDVPIALMVGENDVVAPLECSRWIKDNLDSNILKFYKEYKYGHLSFISAKDMCYLDDVDKLLKEYSS